MVYLVLLFFAVYLSWSTGYVHGKTAKEPADFAWFVATGIGLVLVFLCCLCIALELLK